MTTKWKKPELTILKKRKSSDAVLRSCRTGGIGMNTKNGGCAGAEKDSCPMCREG